MFLFNKKSRARRRVLYILRNYPQYSQTYIKNEIAALGDEYDFKIVAIARPNVTDPDHYPYKLMPEKDAILKLVKKFKPTIIHSHYLNMLPLVNEVSVRSGVPFTLRSHSFDVLGPLRQNEAGLKEGNPDEPMHKLSQLTGGGNCLGVLCFPFLRKPLIETGLAEQRAIAVPPVVDARRFYNRAENGTSVLNVGAPLPKKKMDDFIALSKEVPDREFNLLALGHISSELRQLNERANGRVNFLNLVPTNKIAAVYKQHEWLVYTACPETNTVGWPMALAEAQAAGLGVCMADIRPDLREYTGTSAYFYKHIGELQEVLRGKPDPQMREAGFENALNLDVRLHIHKLTDLWESVN